MVDVEEKSEESLNPYIFWKDNNFLNFYRLIWIEFWRQRTSNSEIQGKETLELIQNFLLDAKVFVLFNNDQFASWLPVQQETQTRIEGVPRQ